MPLIFSKNALKLVLNFYKFLIFNLFIKIIIHYLYISIKVNKNHYDIINCKIHKKFYFNLICFIGFLFNFI